MPCRLGGAEAFQRLERGQHQLQAVAWWQAERVRQGQDAVGCQGLQVAGEGLHRGGKALGQGAATARGVRVQDNQVIRRLGCTGEPACACRGAAAPRVEPESDRQSRRARRPAGQPRCGPAQPRRCARRRGAGRGAGRRPHSVRAGGRAGGGSRAAAGRAAPRASDRGRRAAPGAREAGDRSRSLPVDEQASCGAGSCRFVQAEARDDAERDRSLRTTCTNPMGLVRSATMAVPSTSSACGSGLNGEIRSAGQLVAAARPTSSTATISAVPASRRCAPASTSAAASGPVAATNGSARSGRTKPSSPTAASAPMPAPSRSKR